jgi:hypothetical protein
MRVLTERRLASNGKRLRALREELRVLDEQRLQFNDDADDTRIRSLVSESPFDGREATDAERHANAMTRRRADVVKEIAVLEIKQDELLDQLTAG